MEKARGKGEWWKQAQRGGRDQCRQRYSATKICLVKKYKRSRALLQTNYSLLTLGSGGHKEVAPAVAHGDQNLGELIVAEIFEAERLRQLEAAAQPCVAVPEQSHHLTLVAYRQNERKQINPTSTWVNPPSTWGLSSDNLFYGTIYILIVVQSDGVRGG